MLGVVSSIAADAGYLVLVPLGAAAFHSLGRHPLAGLAAAFSGVAAVFLVNVFVTPTDALLAEMTNDAIRLVDPAREVTLVGNLYFMIASSILMGIVCTVLTEKVVEPHLGPYEGGVPVEGQVALTPSQSRGLRWAGWALLGYVVVVGLLLVPPGAPLRHPETGEILSGSPFMSGPDRADQRALLHHRLRLRQGRRDGEGPDRGDQHGGEDLRRHGGADLPPAGHRPVRRLLQLHQHRDGAGGEPRRLPRDGAARRDELHHHLRAGDLPARPHPHRGGGEVGDLRAGLHPALHAARRRPEPGARRLPRRRLAGERHHAAERLSRR